MSQRWLLGSRLLADRSPASSYPGLVATVVATMAITRAARRAIEEQQKVRSYNYGRRETNLAAASSVIHSTRSSAARSNCTG